MKHSRTVKVLLFSALIGLMATQIYGCMRYGLFPTNPVSVSPDSPPVSVSPDSPLFSLERTLTGHSDWVSSVAFRPDGKILASGSHDNTIKLWNVATGREIATLTRHSESVNSVAFSPDGKTLASGSLDKTIKLWDVATRREIATLTGYSESVVQ
jgi:WD40 repeat protein